MKPANLAVPSLFILVLMISVGPFGDTLYTPSLPDIATSLQVAYSDVQLTMTAYLCGYAVSQLLYGPFSDRFGRRPLMLIGALAFVIGSFICMYSDTIWWLISGRFVQGLGACAGAVISSAAVRDAFPRSEQGKVFAKMNIAFAIAPGL
ncbi:MFS transporter, partial [Francisellaceae bacterium]|nr:MFS transporter [Francisellaceae bacterium]